MNIIIIVSFLIITYQFSFIREQTGFNVDQIPQSNKPTRTDGHNDTYLFWNTLRGDSFEGHSIEGTFRAAIVPFQAHHCFTICNKAGYKAGYRKKKLIQPSG